MKKSTIVIGILLTLIVVITFFLYSQRKNNQVTTLNTTPVNRSTVTNTSRTTNSGSTRNTTSNTSSNTTTSSDGITLAEVSQHASASDCWMAVDGGVYDVTGFIPQHPGGSDILQGCGMDASTLFHTQGGRRGHSSFAEAELSQLRIGTLAN